MIVSHRHRYIFLKVSKTAGTSIELALTTHSGPDDIITGVSPADEELRRSLGARGPQHDRLPLRLFGWKDWANLVRGRWRSLASHPTAREIRHLVGERVWSTYRKICVVRNPWDRVISEYFWRCRDEPRPPLMEFLDSRFMQVLQRRGIEVYTIDGQVVADRVCRFENLQQHIAEEWTALGLPGEATLPRAKTGFRVDRRPYRELLGPEERDRIAKLFAREIELFGYVF